ncbi:hypothetical protein Q0Z83_015940 [Actinoplanes sichuanensis]|uniref:2'-5' RNA ligase family protein n=1 Tax=Actinoplanes sichuanensis TaxID=512349 RepID=A0ABW4A6L7_9ACTN|nr:2'-5' RNA ligase family protein [Actinoplanes sichuanensis]BEL03403.1 hypothetical protein Q0Z83_015940 [Actinoplanes sichuanensis]
MPHAIELFLDEQSDRRVRQIWTALDEHGVPSLGSRPGADYHPHVSLSVLEHDDPARIADALRPVLATATGLPLPLASLGFFLTDESVAFLGAIPSQRFLTLHRRVHEAVEPIAEDIRPYYRPDRLLPHCTLATGVTDRAAVLDVMSAFPLPILAVTESAQLVEVPGGHHRIALTPPGPPR